MPFLRVSLLIACGLAGLFTTLSGQTAAINPAYDQPYRPQFHFSPKEHWTNDPNGLVFFEGEYHLFYQYNPFGDEWGHMSWGHAVSPDLTHWTQLPIALPEENGVMIFTGSTVVDQHDTSGFCQGGRSCLLAIYTGHTPETKTKPALQTQNIAYSNDRGRTWTKYSANPVLNLNMSDFRDPKVFWSEASRRWIMAVSLPNDHKVRFYGSPDLKKWDQISEFGPAGATGGQWECPEIFELPADGKPGNTRWVLKVGLNPGSLQGGSGEQYFVGRFDGTRFINDNPASLTLGTDYGKDCYCALTFNNLPKAHTAVMLGWMDNWQYAAKLPTSPWRGQMTIPRKLSLRSTPAGLRLAQQPADEIQSLREQQFEAAGRSAGELNFKLASVAPKLGSSFELETEFSMGSSAESGLKLFVGPDEALVIGYARQREKLFIDRTHAGVTEFSKDFPARTEASLTINGDKLTLHMLIDRNSVELFAQQGQVTMTNLVFPSTQAPRIETYVRGGQLASVSLKAWRLRSIYETVDRR